MSFFFNTNWGLHNNIFYMFKVNPKSCVTHMSYANDYSAFIFSIKYDNSA